MRRLLLIVLPVVALAACDGPREKTGREQDKVAADTSGVAYTGEGSAERAGETQDRAERSARQARDAQVDALKDQAKDVRRDADRSADALEEQAREIRERAGDQADALRQRARQVDAH